MFLSIIVEGVRLNSGHLSHRMNRIPFRQYWVALFFFGVVMFLLAALIRSRSSRRPNGARTAKSFLIVGLMLVAGCRAEKTTVREPASPKSPPIASPVPFSEINLAAIGHLAPKGRVQDREYNKLPVIDSLKAHGKESIPFLISKLDDETEIDHPVIDYWHKAYVGDVALVVLTDFFTDSTGLNTTIPGIGFDEFLERRGNKDLMAEQVLRNYIAKHGRRQIKERWQESWAQHEHQIVWSNAESCFKIDSSGRF
jgi:hypothetical protein